jgi:hypothetical protein
MTAGIIACRPLPKKMGIREDAQIQEEIHESGEWSLKSALG